MPCSAPDLQLLTFPVLHSLQNPLFFTSYLGLMRERHVETSRDCPNSFIHPSALKRGRQNSVRIHFLVSKPQKLPGEPLSTECCCSCCLQHSSNSALFSLGAGNSDWKRSSPSGVPLAGCDTHEKSSFLAPALCKQAQQGQHSLLGMIQSIQRLCLSYC